MTQERTKEKLKNKDTNYEEINNKDKKKFYKKAVNEYKILRILFQEFLKSNTSVMKHKEFDYSRNKYKEKLGNLLLRTKLRKTVMFLEWKKNYI